MTSRFLPLSVAPSGSGVWWTTPRDGRVDPQLGGSAEVQMSPDGEVLVPGGSFTWSAQRDVSYYRLEIRVETAEPTRAPGGMLHDARWQPTPAQRTELPQRFEWRVVGYDDADEPVFTSRWATSWVR